MIPAHDKLKHFYVGDIISIISFIILIGIYFLFNTSPYILTATFLPSMAAGIIKEVRDKKTGEGTPEIMDAVWTMLPGIEKSLIILIILKITLQ